MMPYSPCFSGGELQYLTDNRAKKKKKGKITDICSSNLSQRTIFKIFMMT